jgi:hypothetical protein
MPWRSRRYDWTSVPDIRHSTVGQFAPIAVIPRARESWRKQTFAQLRRPILERDAVRSLASPSDTVQPVGTTASPHSAAKGPPSRYASTASCAAT